MKFLGLILVTLFSVETFANNQIVPNYYRNRRAMNQFSALGFSDRNEATVAATGNQSTREATGTKRAETRTLALSGLIFDRVSDELNLEGVLSIGNSKLEGFNPDESPDDNWVKSGAFGLGYKIPDAPVSFGAQYLHSRRDSKDGPTGVKSHTRTEAAAFGGGVRLPSDLYVGGGVTATWIDDLLPEDEPFWFYSLGVGKVFGDEKTPSAAGEIVLNYQNQANTQEYELNASGLWNQEHIQYFGEASFRLYEGSVQGNKWSVAAGVDYQLQSVYFSPMLTYDSRTTKGSLTEKSSLFAASLELGYRVAPVEAYVRLDYSMDDVNYRTGTDDETVGNALTVGGTYFF